MTFPLDPNAAEPVVLAEVGGEPVAAPGLRAGDALVAEPARAGAGG